MLSSAYQQSQLARGNFSPDTVSVGDLFAGALIPGLMLVVMYIIYLVISAMLKPDALPAHLRQEDEHVSLGKILRAIAPPIILIVAVLGSILGGFATPTEAITRP